MNFEELATKRFDELNQKQKKLIQEHDINSYPNWFYDQASGILTFSGETKEINFRYYEVGTFSTNTNTWKWSWDNEHTLKKVKEKLNEVKEFGEQHSFEKLTTGLFESEEAEAWELTAIACNLLNGIGSYRPVSDHLKIFMVVYELIDNEKAKKEKDKFVDCKAHERSRRAFVCQHLNTGKKTGFQESFETFEDMEFENEDDDLEAWCNECEKIRIANDGWNDESMEFANIKLVCEKCYFEIKNFNKE